MAVDNLTEGNPPTPGGTDANQGPSKAQGQPLADDLASMVKSLQAGIQNLTGEVNALKSGKDKAVDRVEKSVNQTISQLAKYLNVSEEDIKAAQRNQLLDTLVDERLNGGVPNPAPVGTGQGGGVPVESYSVAKAIDLVESYQIPAGDPDFIALLRKGPSEQQVKDFILAKKAPPKEPNPAAVVGSPLVTPANPGTNMAQLEANYQKEMTGLMQLQGNEKIRAITALKEKYRGLGLAKF